MKRNQILSKEIDRYLYKRYLREKTKRPHLPPRTVPHRKGLDPFEIFCKENQTTENTVIIYTSTYPKLNRHIFMAYQAHAFDICFISFYMEDRSAVMEERLSPKYPFPRGVIIENKKIPLYIIYRTIV